MMISVSLMFYQRFDGFQSTHENTSHKFFFLLVSPCPCQKIFSLCINIPGVIVFSCLFLLKVIFLFQKKRSPLGGAYRMFAFSGERQNDCFVFFFFFFLMYLTPLPLCFGGLFEWNNFH